MKLGHFNIRINEIPAKGFGIAHTSTRNIHVLADSLQSAMKMVEKERLNVLVQSYQNGKYDHYGCYVERIEFVSCNFVAWIDLIQK